MKYSVMIVIYMLAILLACSALLFQSKPITSKSNLKQLYKNQLDIYPMIPSTSLSSYSPLKNRHIRGNTKLYSNIFDLRGGSDVGYQFNILSKINEYALSSPTNLFNSLLVGLIGLTVIGKAISSKKNSLQQSKSSSSSSSSITMAVDKKPIGVKSLQFRFLTVFWLLRMADWLQGPYFYEVYSSKIFNGVPASLDLVSKLFLVGFASTGIFGPWIGRFVDTVGRKAGTLAFAALYTIGALSTRSNHLSVLLLGRLAGGLGTSLLFSAPEAWLVGEHQRNGFDGKWLGETFGLAYAGDSLVAITAGQLASITANSAGPSGPFTLSVGFLILGAIFAFMKWDENVAIREVEAIPVVSNIENQVTVNVTKKPSIRDALDVVFKDKRIWLLGATQALFEGSMYIFVLQWGPAIKAAIQASSSFGSNAQVPFGNIFSCFMASCLLGSTLFGILQKKEVVSIEKNTSLMLFLATMAITVATFIGKANLAVLIAAMFVFEACVGMYFPSIGTLRSKYLPDSHRSVIMNLFGIPLNLLVVSVFLSIQSLGVQGALQCASIALGIATICMTALSVITTSKKDSITTTA